MKCPDCDLRLAVVPGEPAQCPRCGFSGRVHPAKVVDTPSIRTPSTVAAKWEIASAVGRSPRQQAKAEKENRYEKAARRRSVTGLVLNVFVPGVGSITAGRKGEGKLQLLLLLIGILTVPFLIGIAVIPGVWVWAVTAGLQDVFFSNK